ncbi:unnamed protein product [Nesidiocoris tenuis]|uniref:Uncharacterized protein n=1 Tax=Nesidiocoris tenuis TaxID=355587 RepID=A0A6H5H7I5_9HEMI|nr:unnamed protein product [Nesidiocoris tenuis]
MTSYSNPTTLKIFGIVAIRPEIDFLESSAITMGIVGSLWDTFWRSPDRSNTLVASKVEIFRPRGRGVENKISNGPYEPTMNRFCHNNDTIVWDPDYLWACSMKSVLDDQSRGLNLLGVVIGPGLSKTGLIEKTLNRRNSNT